jgi:hypothetical protein
VSFEQDDGTEVTAVLQDRRTYRYGARAAEAYYLPHIAADGEPQQQDPTTTPRHRHVDGPAVLYHTITAIVELRRICPFALRGRRVDIACVPPAPAAVYRRPTGA